jgi:formamidopyrimidine-DNA glycosylase
MPELPEVETIVIALRQGGRAGPPLLDQVIKSTILNWERSLADPTPAEFYARLPGQAVAEICRRGKFIVFRLSRDYLLIHLRMSGDLRVEPDRNSQGEVLPLAPHDRAVFYFADNLRMAFNDPRKFGRIWLTPDSQTVLSGLGPEPLDPALTQSGFYVRLNKVHRQLKPLLLDQSFLAGIGNIYSDEALHLAGLHPLLSSGDLSEEQAGVLLSAIRQVLTSGIHQNGASIDWVYRGGEFQNSFRVYQRTGQPCPVCGHPIERILVGQRGTHFCPVCQPLKKVAVI